VLFFGRLVDSLGVSILSKIRLFKADNPVKSFKLLTRHVHTKDSYLINR
jgi:hypothetical protein